MNLGTTSHRGWLLGTVVVTALVLAACGRATEEQIDQALGITPTPTLSAADLAAATEAAVATEEAKAAALASPGAGGAMFLGDAAKGKTTFTMWCANCHTPGGPGGDILAAGGPGATIEPASFTAFIREGTNHKPGKYEAFKISDGALTDLGTYIQTESNK